MTDKTTGNSILSDFDISQFTDFEYVRDTVIFRVVNYEKNREKLDEIPHIRFHDLAVTFCCHLYTDEESTAIIRITDNHTKLWNVTAGELFDLAKINTPRLLPYRFDSMYNVLEGMCRNEDEILPVADDLAYPLYILTNSTKLHGAACLLYDGILEELKNKIGEDFYILPSSIHELIILPRSFADSRETLDSMVKEVNSTQLEPDEVLADHVYLYKDSLLV